MGTSPEFWNFFEGEAAPRLALRANTFRTMFEYLDRLNRPVNIIETGCARVNDWSGEGQSTILFDKYIHHHAAESKLYSVDINKSAIDYASTFTGPKTTLTSDDSVKYLARLTADFLMKDRTADLVYLDAYDLDWHHWYPSAAHHLMELCAVLRILRKDTLVVVDDCANSAYFVRGQNNAINFISPPIIGGKGRMVAEFAARIGAKVEFAEYQAGWSGF
ncbi:MAG: class I SAM-dependent methyltransferase [Alphaproteobacteria bacterium]|nr:class I SAM-dependent methyltransferase [Alphaproteobacteria bacterium]